MMKESIYYCTLYGHVHSVMESQRLATQFYKKRKTQSGHIDLQNLFEYFRISLEDANKNHIESVGILSSPTSEAFRSLWGTSRIWSNSLEDALKTL